MGKILMNFALLRVFCVCSFKHTVVAKKGVCIVYRTSQCFLNRLLLILFLLLTSAVFAQANETPVTRVDSSIKGGREDNAGYETVKEGKFKLLFIGFSTREVKEIEAYLIQHSAYSSHHYEFTQAFNSLLNINIRTDVDELTFILEKILVTTKRKAHLSVTANNITLTGLVDNQPKVNSVPKGVW